MKMGIFLAATLLSGLVYVQCAGRRDPHLRELLGPKHSAEFGTPSDSQAGDGDVFGQPAAGEYGQNLVWGELDGIKVTLTGLGGPIVVVDPASENPGYVRTLADGGLPVPERIVYVNAGGAPAAIRASFADSSSDLTATVSQVELGFNDTEIGTVLADVEAYDPSGRLVDEDRQSTPQSTYGEMVLADPSIAYLLITTDADGAWLSALKFSP